MANAAAVDIVRITGRYNRYTGEQKDRVTLGPDTPTGRNDNNSES